MRRTLFYLIKKEFIQLIRDRRLLPLLFIMPIVQLLVYGYIFSTDVKYLSTAVRDLDRSQASRELVSSFRSAGYFQIHHYVESERELARLVERGEVQIAINIPSGFSRRINQGRVSEVQILVDGSDSNVASAGLAYSSRIIASKALPVGRQAPRIKGLPAVEERIRVLYNPDLKSLNYMIPAVIGFLLVLTTLILTAAALVRERERGTLEQLIVMPIRRYELILGKILPFILIGLINIILGVVVGTLWFNVPLRGSVVLLLVLTMAFVFTNLGLGLFISTVSKTQQQAMTSAYFIMLPSMLLSGLIYPIESMPRVIQYVTYLIPLRYMLTIVRGIFLKGAGFRELWQDTLILTVYGLVIFALSVLRFRKKLT